MSSLTVQAINMTAIRVSWTPPLNPNGDISAYQIYYYKAPEQNNPASIASVNIDQWLNIKVRLRVNTLYTFTHWTALTRKLLNSEQSQRAFLFR